MACPAIHTGEQFLAATLAHIDCQARTIGGFGYGALADPSSPVSLALTGLLTIFIALFAVRLLLGFPMAGRDLVADFLKIGIVLTLATSWPAWRVLGYDLVIDGPAQIANVVGLASGLPGSAGDLTGRLQQADGALAALGTLGSGRLGVAQGDWLQLGLARIFYLVGTLGPLALLRLMAGILVALAPLLAGLLLFGVTRSIFAGWAKALALTYLASIVLTLVLGIELALLEPWLQDALDQRAAELQILDAPVEILVLTSSFALIAIGMLAVVAWISFHPSLSVSGLVASLPEGVGADRAAGSVSPAIFSTDEPPSRAQRVALAVQGSLWREERMGRTSPAGDAGQLQPAPAGHATSGPLTEPGSRLGGSYRRNARRVSAAGRTRDQLR